jgi:hypothetical protein
MPILRSHHQLLLIQLLTWIDHKSYRMSEEEGSTKNTRRKGMRTQHLYQIEEHSLCMTIVTLDLLRMGSDHLAEVEEEGLELGVHMHLESMKLSRMQRKKLC